ncbi:MAG: glycosyltransferase family 4 protein [Gemmatimonadota bacterium]
MRVIHVVTAFPRDPEDPITPWLPRLLTELRRRGVESEVLAPSYRGRPAGRPYDIPVHRFRYGPAAWEALSHDQTVPDRLRESPRYALLLPTYVAGGSLAAWRLGRGRPDVMHVHWPVPHALFGAAARRASAGHAALVCSYYSVELSWVEHRLRWLRPFLRWTVRTADGVTAISSWTAERVRTLVDRPVRVIPFSATVQDGSSRVGVDARAGAGVEATPEPGSSEEGAVAPRIPFQDKEMHLLFVGRLVERKGVEVLVRALPRILARRPARLTIVGEGSRERNIRAAATASGVEPVIRFAGHVSREELSRLYATCDLFVLPAVVDAKGDTEGLGVVLLEALRFARPVVASAVGGIPDIVQDGRSGWLVPPGDPAALAGAILRIAADPEAARRIGEAGRRRVERRFSWERITGELMDCYMQAVARRRGEGA